MKMKITLLAAIICLSALFSGVSVGAEGTVQLTVTPGLVNIGAFYNGTTITATGTVPAESHVIVRFLGSSCDLHMKQKGKLFGIMWMNLDSLIFRGVPSVCIVSSAQDLDNLAQTAGGEWPVIKDLRLAGLQQNARVESNGGDQVKAFEELIKLKNNEGLYLETSGNISYGEAINGQKSFRVEIRVPSRLSPGKYVVELAAVNGGELIAHAEQPVTVNLVGFPALLSKLAFGHAALYGILATIIALLAGLAIGMVFDSKGAH